MVVNRDNPEHDRAQIAHLAMRLMGERGADVTRAAVATAAGLSRARIEALLPEENDLFEAVAAEWFAEPAAIMEQVVSSDLPPNRKMFEFFARRFRLQRERFRADPAAYATYCELGSARFAQVRSHLDLADHYLCELIAQAQADGAFAGLGVDEALSLINQMVMPYIHAEAITFLDDRLSEDKLARIVDTLFAGLSARDGGARGVSGLRAA